MHGSTSMKFAGIFSRRWLRLLFALMAAGQLAACGSECDSCDNDDDCDSGQFCAEFTDGESRCADDSDTTCQ